MTAAAGTIRISKLDAARRQLQTAIKLWFEDGDPVATHALAFAAYEVIHTVSKKRDPNRPDLLFDSSVVKEECRSEFNILIKKFANFFKHGDRDGEAVVEFYPASSQMFILFAIRGLEFCGERMGPEELAFNAWIVINKPHFLTDKGGKRLADHLPVDNVLQLQELTKSEFFEVCLAAFTQGCRQ